MYLQSGDFCEIYVTDVVDGDTLSALILVDAIVVPCQAIDLQELYSCPEERFRLCGADTREKGEDLFVEASQALTKMVSQKMSVAYITNPSAAYGRVEAIILPYDVGREVEAARSSVETFARRSFNFRLIWEGWAKHDSRYTRPEWGFDDAEARGREARLGIWDANQ